MDRALGERFNVEVPKRLAELLGVSEHEIEVERHPFIPGGKPGEVDMIARVGKFNFVVECKTTADTAMASTAARQVKAFAGQLKRKSIPVVAVPYMGEVGRRLCDEAEVSWLDLSGNAHLFGSPGLHVRIEGRPNLFKRRGRPRSVFAPKSSRIARCLFVQAGQAIAQRELARMAGMDEGFTSRIVRRLEEQQLLARDDRGAVRVTNAAGLMEAWRDAYDFSRHHIIRGHIAERSSEALLQSLSVKLKKQKIEYAATGVAAAWVLNRFTGFRLVVMYVAQLPSPQVQQALGFREEPRGENVWLVVPNDEGVFHGAGEHDGIRCVHPVQLYLDLKNHPERSAEAAEQVRKTVLNNMSHA